MTATESPVEFVVDGEVATITLNRPDKRNAINAEMTGLIEAAVDRIEADPQIRVGILRATTSGRRPVFCAGHDLTTGADGEGAVTARGGFAGLVRRDRTKPLIACVNGLA